jgi:hypothetical protein
LSLWGAERLFFVVSDDEGVACAHFVGFEEVEVSELFYGNTIPLSDAGEGLPGLYFMDTGFGDFFEGRHFLIQPRVL